VGEGPRPLAKSPRSDPALAARLRSFGHAARGVRTTVAAQPNARIHAVASVLVVALGLALGLPAASWAALLLAMGLVWAAELLNTALEALADAVAPDHHEGVGRAKDAAAGAVLVAAVAAAGVGLLVLGPPRLRALH